MSTPCRFRPTRLDPDRLVFAVGLFALALSLLMTLMSPS